MIKYWGSYIGGSDDSLTLLEYLAAKKKTAIPLSEIFADTGLNRLNGDFRTTEPMLVYVDSKGEEFPFYYAIDLVADLAALLLACRENGSVSPAQMLDGGEGAAVTIVALPKELGVLRKALADFAENPLAYDLSESMAEEELQEMAQECRQLCAEWAE